MKIIYPELQSSVSATSEDANYPALNLLDSKPKKVWRADSTNTAILTVSIGAGASALALFRTNAATAVVVMKDSGGATIQTTNITLSYNRIWVGFPVQAGVCSAEITVTSAVGSVVEAGIIRAGTALEVNNPDWGMGEGKRDFSIVAEMSNGSDYVRLRDIVRTFSPSWEIIPHAQARSIQNIYDIYGKTPLAMLILSGIGADHEYAVFGKLDSEPDRKYSLGSHSQLSFSVAEVV